MASNAEVQKQLSRLASLYRPAVPATLKDGKPNPQFIAMREEYLRCLGGFSSNEIEMGFDDLIAGWKYQTWPSPAQCASACAEHHSRLRLLGPDGANQRLKIRGDAIRRMVRPNSHGHRLSPPKKPGSGDPLWTSDQVEECHRAGHISADDAQQAIGMLAIEIDDGQEFSEAHRLIMARGYRNCMQWIKTGEIASKTKKDGLTTPCRDEALEKQIQRTRAEAKFFREEIVL